MIKNEFYCPQCKQSFELFAWFQNVCPTCYEENKKHNQALLNTKRSPEWKPEPRGLTRPIQSNIPEAEK